MWEVVVQDGAGRLALPVPVEHLVRTATAEAALTPLHVTAAQALAVADLPLHHRDPFDRLLVAQAHVDGLALVTADRVLQQYAGAAVQA